MCDVSPLRALKGIRSIAIASQCPFHRFRRALLALVPVEANNCRLPAAAPLPRNLHSLRELSISIEFTREAGEQIPSNESKVTSNRVPPSVVSLNSLEQVMAVRVQLVPPFVVSFNSLERKIGLSSTLATANANQIACPFDIAFNFPEFRKLRLQVRSLGRVSVLLRSVPEEECKNYEYASRHDGREHPKVLPLQHRG